VKAYLPSEKEKNMFSNSFLRQTATTIVFIDASLSDYQTLQAGIIEGVKSVIISPNQDGIEQISQILQQHPHITTIHILSHGAPGCLYLGNIQLNLTNIHNYTQQLQQWQRQNILLYGCNVAAGDAGGEFIHNLHQITNATISASTTKTGNAALGGNWELEVNIPENNGTSLVFHADTLNTYQGIFAPTLVGEYNTSGNANGVQIVGNYAYVADDSGLQIIDISNPTTPILKGTYNTTGSNHGVQIVGNYAYVTPYSKLQIIDISNPTTPILKGTYNISGDAYGIQIVGNYAYVANGYLGLQIIDISNPTIPILKGTYYTSGQPYGVQIVGSYAYVAVSSSGLEIIDISDPTIPILKGTYDTSGTAESVQVVGNYAYVADNGSGLQIIDISNPLAPTLKGNYNTSGTATGVQVVGNYAYVADHDSGLQIIDISNPTTPTLKGNYNTSGYAWRVQVVGNYAYVADSEGGLKIIDVSEFTNLYTAIESVGNTKLVKDESNNYFTQIGTNTPVAIKNGGQQIYQNIYGSGWQTIAAETINGDNQVLWKNVSGNYLHIWNLDNNWNWVSSEGNWGLNSAEALTQETVFGIDANGDGVIGYTPIELAGNTKLVKDSTNKYFTQIGTNTPTAIKNGGQQIYQDIYGSGWQTIATETVNGDNQVLWKNVSGNYLHIWHLDNNWNWVSSEGNWGLNSAEALTQETNFSIDANGDGVIGNPYTAIESAGNTKLVKDSTNKYFTQIGTNTPIAIKNGGQQISQDIYGSGWQTIATETVNGDNQVLWKNVSGNYLHIWHLDNNWNWVSSEGNWGLNSADAFTQETVFGIDANSDGKIGNPSSLTLTGTSGNDILIGGANSDTFNGGLGNDTLYLGLNDNAVDNVNYASGDGTDTVYQFVRGVGGDKLNFTGIANLDVVTLGANTEVRIGDGIAANTGFGTGQLLVTLSGTSGFTSANANINLFGGAFLFN
jgi:hypothetical protein